MTTANQSSKNFKKPKTVFHVTLKENLPSILDNGIDPQFSPRNFKASWFVDRYKINWAINHTIEKFPHLNPTDFVVFKVELKRVERKHLKRFSMKGLFYAQAHFYPTSYKEISE